MALRILWRWWREAFVSLFRNGWLAASATGMVLVSLFLLGFVSLFALNAAHFSRLVENQVEVAVFLQDNLAPDLVRQLGRELRQIEGVAQVTFVSKEEALAKLKRDLGDKSGLLSGLEEQNPLPDSFRLRPKDAAAVPLIAKEAAALPGVEKVRYGEGVVEKLVKITNSVRLAALALVALFGLAAVFLIVTTIRLSILSRQEEIGIMKLLGATNWFIRGPFILEGLIIGTSGALLATAILYWGYAALVGQIEQAALIFFQPVTEKAVLLPVFGAIFGAGLILGALSSALSVHRFLTV
ncbi:cell division protein FtsX [Thermodesulfitimonas autotrophica]|uniref:Cell division protein FtsX n=1 Tax=Thermodesulfitimonas autotrophica TaxID=1894989 RepID=A0A3N5AWZ3_9THEO|nr:permease-like cell division protein FtsX [Thermodesulfitimonas autotrophica]RPF49403.1 cell division protein FtsX [Thermodesulfitimonas autotrophica]